MGADVEMPALPLHKACWSQISVPIFVLNIANADGQDLSACHANSLPHYARFRNTFPASFGSLLYVCTLLYHDMTFENMILLLFSLFWVRSCFFVPPGSTMIERVSHWVLIHLWVLCARVFVQVLPGTQLFRFCLFTFLQSSYIAFFAPCTFWYVISKEVPGQLWAHSWSCILESLYRILGYSCRI